MWRGFTLVSLLVSFSAGQEPSHADDPNAADSMETPQMDPGCKNGQCPFSGSEPTSEECGIWMGPSPIKHAEEHGFGLGMFTGKAIKKGTTLESLYGAAGELILPIYASLSIHNDHTPLREYVWDENNLPELAIEYPDEFAYQFSPGAAAIIPCTSQNYNLDLLGDGKEDHSRESLVSDTSRHRTRHATAGAVASRSQLQYVAVRDIAAGEELTCRCTDDDFDGGVYYLSRYQAADDALFCVDQNVRVGPSKIDGAGQGLLAKRAMQTDEVIITSPMVPLLRKEMDIDDDEINSKQLLLNYCLGHENSNLLLLPYGPLVNFINHYGGDDTITRRPNAKIQWHPVSTADNASIERRQQHHHPELFAFSAETVGKTHGVSLTMDIVATRPIAPGDEIYLDYGQAWQSAWMTHVSEWKEAVAKGELDPNYIPAEAFVVQNGGLDVAVRTEDEQQVHPYPENIHTYCYYSQDQTRDDSYNNFDVHVCFRPCTILERTQQLDGEYTYNVQLEEKDNPHIISECVIAEDLLLTDVPHRNVRIVDKPYTTDVFLKTAFRQEIGVPEGFFPPAWQRRKLRSRKTADEDLNLGEEFKRKTPNSGATRGVVEITMEG